MAGLIADHLPRAYAGARIAPPVVEGAAQPAMVAEAPIQRPIAQPKVEGAPVQVASATPEAAIPPAAPARKPLDLNTLRPVVASAAGASSTTTPSSGNIRWQKGPEPLPLNAQAYAALQAPDKEALQAKIETKAAEPVKTASIKEEAPKAEPKKTVDGWVVQLGATDDEAKAKAMLDSARSKFGKILKKASPYTEKVTVDGSTLYRARFSGFSESNDAAKACQQLKKGGLNCFASRG
jgi:D-alanyl-D-alanine carboxypeptidase